MAEVWRLRFEFHYDAAAPLWAADDPTRAEFGGGVSWVPAERLPLSEETIARMYDVQEWFDRSMDWDNAPQLAAWSHDECDRFNDAARELYEAIALELGSDFVVSFEQEALTPQPSA